DKQDQQSPQDQQDKQDQQSPQDQQDKQDQQSPQDQQDKQSNQDRDKQNPPTPSDDKEQMQPNAQPELSDKEKAEQRAAAILKMHLDEEGGSPIPHPEEKPATPRKDY
ncbi:MAG: hypothetical protein ACI4O9_01490, partial [Akkermansia sp.]